MPLYALDSDIVSLLLRDHPRVTARVAATPPAELTLPIVTVQELLAGWLPHLTRPQPPGRYVAIYSEFRQALDFARTVALLDFDMAAATEYTRLRTTYRRLGTNDLRIAAIALTARAVMVTANTSDFGQIAGLTVEDWSR
jgi:tRNA(fMet)-specific endonuclease VapC